MLSLVYPGNETAWMLTGRPHTRPTCYPAVSGGKSAIRLSLGRLPTGFPLIFFWFKSSGGWGKITPHFHVYSYTSRVDLTQLHSQTLIFENSTIPRVQHACTNARQHCHHASQLLGSGAHRKTCFPPQDTADPKHASHSYLVPDKCSSAELDAMI